MSKNRTAIPRDDVAYPPRAHSKAERVLHMLAREGGATMAQVIEATGWQEHSVRAAITGLKKRGYGIEWRREGAASFWAIVSSAAEATV